MAIEGLLAALQPNNLLYLLFGTFYGLIIGILPAVGPNFALALILPFTFSLPPATAIIFLVATHAATAYGDSIASILLNTPGGPGTVASCWDGYHLTKKGRGGAALGMATMGSFVGGLIGWVCLMMVARPITDFALAIGAPEYFALGVAALALVSIASKGETIKGLILAGVGLIFSFVGQDPILGNTNRFTFGSFYLGDGINIVAATLGLFALAQVIELFVEGGTIAVKTETIKDSVFSGYIEVFRRLNTVFRSGVIGILLGIMPALGTATASIMAYLAEKQAAGKDSHLFGKGHPAGLIAPETAKGACVIGDLIPTITLGIPGSVATAILLAALTMHNLRPGPEFLLQGIVPYTIFGGILLAQFSFLISGTLLAKYFVKIVSLPNSLMAPFITLLVFVGAYSLNNSMFNVYVTIFFGILGYILKKLNYPAVCIALGLILGNLVEANYHRSIKIGDGSALVFFQRPISVLILVIAVVFLLSPYIMDFVKMKMRHKKADNVK